MDHLIERLLHLIDHVEQISIEIHDQQAKDLAVDLHELCAHHRMRLARRCDGISTWPVEPLPN
jgi:hypothetical protein